MVAQDVPETKIRRKIGGSGQGETVVLAGVILAIVWAQEMGSKIVQNCWKQR